MRYEFTCLRPIVDAINVCGACPDVLYRGRTAYDGRRASIGLKSSGLRGLE
jgi:hypothetical protein